MRSCLVLLVLALGLCACDRSVPPAKAAATPAAPGVRFARVHYRDAADLQHLADHYDALEQVDREAGTITLLLSVPQYEALRAGGYRIDVDAVQTELLNNPPPARNEAGIPGYACYRTVEETHDALRDLAAARPDLVELRDGGDSWLRATTLTGGYDLTVARLTNRGIPGDKPVFFLHAAVHAREYTTAELATRFAEHLVNGYGVDADATWILDHFEVHVMPQANPDGRKLAEAQFYWRKNFNAQHCPGVPPTPAADLAGQGVDLNRNSSFHWGELGDGGSSGFDCDQTYRGPAAASEPETQAVERYARGVFRDRRGPGDADAAPADAEGVFISLHSFGGLVLYPWGHTTRAPAPNQAALEALGMKFSRYNGYLVCWDCLYLANGSTDDFVYGDLGVAAYTFELGRESFFESCETFESGTYPDNLPALVHAAKSARRPYQTSFGPDVVGALATPGAAGAPAVLTAEARDLRYDDGGMGDAPRPRIAAARYSIGLPSWKAARTFPMRAADGAFDSPVEQLAATIDTAALQPGRHLVLVEARDAAGHWGVPSAAFVTVTR